MECFYFSDTKIHQNVLAHIKLQQQFLCLLISLPNVQTTSPSNEVSILFRPPPLDQRLVHPCVACCSAQKAKQGWSDGTRRCDGLQWGGWREISRGGRAHGALASLPRTRAVQTCGAGSSGAWLAVSPARAAAAARPSEATGRSHRLRCQPCKAKGNADHAYLIAHHTKGSLEGTSSCIPHT